MSELRSAAAKTVRPAGRGKIYNDITETIGDTPLVRLNQLAVEAGAKAEILMKLEFFNPVSSVKDRIGVSMIEALEAQGKLVPGSVVVEPTSGNTGIALAFVCAAKGYRLILCMPETMSIERRKMLALLGAELELTPADEHMRGAVERAEELLQSIPNAVMPQQFENPANPNIHQTTTGEEIWNDTNGQVDAIVCGVGTGGTLTGIGRFMREKKPSCQIIAVEPEDSAILAGGSPGPHSIEGLGPGFIPSILDRSLVDDVVTIGNETAFSTSRDIAKKEGIPVGISSGAAVAAALEVGCRPQMAGKMVVTVIPSFAERYLSTALFDGLQA